ncbi:YjbQ family protein [Candidatus Microgenomates bacterium]|nr:YjbQ family protein [Candidatus Microgenomates bacterium]
MIKLIIKTNKAKQALDITDIINQEIKKLEIKDGVCNLFVTHTTASITTADLDPGTDQDYLGAFEKLIPKLDFHHPHDPQHTPDHILSSLIGTSITLPVENGKLVLGIWQRVVLMEFNGPRERNIVVSMVSSR